MMVWFHGGHFKHGTGSEARYHGGVLAEHGCVIVSVNYRLNAFGFGVKVPGGDYNCGLWDQIEALKWVQTHITHFGGGETITHHPEWWPQILGLSCLEGDPNRVTIFGQGSGGTSCLLLSASEKEIRTLSPES